MYINMRRAEGLDGNEIVSISRFCTSLDFKTLHALDSSMETTRLFSKFECEGLPSLFTIKHTGFSGGQTPYSMTVTHVARYGLLNLFSLAESSSQSSILYWAIAPVMPATRWSGFGVLVYSRPPEPEFDIQILSTTDGLVIAADDHYYSTMVSVEHLKFHAT